MARCATRQDVQRVKGTQSWAVGPRQKLIWLVEKSSHLVFNESCSLKVSAQIDISRFFYVMRHAVVIPVKTTSLSFP